MCTYPQLFSTIKDIINCVEDVEERPVRMQLLLDNETPIVVRGLRFYPFPPTVNVKFANLIM